MLRNISQPTELCITAPYYGVPSETYIRRHVYDLLPGRTAMIAFEHRSSSEPAWVPPGPHMVIGRCQSKATNALRSLSWAAQCRLGAVLDDCRIAAFLKAHGVRTLLCEYLQFSLPFLSLCKQLGIRVFAHAHGFDVSAAPQVGTLLQHYQRLNGAAGIIVVSHRMEADVRALGITTPAIHVVPCGVGVPVYPPHRSNGSVVRVLSVGRMIGKKGPILLLDAFRRAVERYSAMVLELVGDGEMMGAIKQFIRAFNLEDKVVLHGSQDPQQVSTLLLEADVYMQHSWQDPISGDSEGLPVSILEAMASALPVVATAHAGIPEAVSHGTTGYLVPAGDSCAMGDALLRLARDYELRTQFGKCGWERVNRCFSWDIERRMLCDVMGLHF